MQRPTGVTILAVLVFLVTCLYIVAALVFFLGGAALSQLGGGPSGATMDMGAMLAGLGAFAGVIMLALAVFSVAVGVGLWKLQNWGRILAIVFIVLGLISALAGVFSAVAEARFGPLLWGLIVVGIDVWILWYLFRPHVKQAFGVS